ncbi:hypothetical protein J1G43_01465 [Cellulomonas sp. zg-ZUI22]|uniref:hypothetical protein n=1 Tax=Cellulomonas sp. zg-ZUI22 TaxID=2816955 RepID=UPI001A93EDC8|nr:hypothetical protein [Cellulomonas sp. zg-ZUI22]MBO0898632.1 hypothetical protein [Cellulomonas sp. zg-ZUI22]
MTDEQHDRTTPEGDVKRPRSDQESGAFVALGVVFFVLGISGAARGETALTAFLAVGVVFFAIGVGGGAKARAQADGTEDGRRDRSTGGDGGAAAHDGDARPAPDDATGSDAAGTDNGVGDGGGGGGDGGGGGGGGGD